MSSEIVFLVEEDPDGGYTARSVHDSIFTQADDLDALRGMIRDAVRCHFPDESERPKVIRQIAPGANSGTNLRPWEDKMRELLCVCAAALIAISAAGCVTPTSFSGYLEDRRQDLIDVAHVDITSWQMGAVMYVGPLIVGYAANVTLDLRGGLGPWGGGAAAPEPNAVQLGLGGWREAHREGEAYGILWPGRRWSDRLRVPPRRDAPSVSAIGFSMGWYPGIGAEFDPLELADFILGLVCVDVCKDDVHVVSHPSEPRPSAPKN